MLGVSFNTHRPHFRPTLGMDAKGDTMRHHVTANIFRALQDTKSSWFLREILEKAVTMDEADAMVDVERAAELIRDRADVFLGKRAKED